MGDNMSHHHHHDHHHGHHHQTYPAYPAAVTVAAAAPPYPSAGYPPYPSACYPPSSYPSCPPPSCIAVPAYQYVEWVSSGEGGVPYHSSPVEGGHDGECLFVGRAHFGGDLIPGKVHPSHRVCYVPHAGGEHSVHHYEVLCNPSRVSLRWVHCGDGSIPPGALQGGHTCSGEPLYVGRTHHNGSLTPGKVHPSHRCLYIPYGGQEVQSHHYEILVVG